jgi:hypothetical protein
MPVQAAQQGRIQEQRAPAQQLEAQPQGIRLLLLETLLRQRMLRTLQLLRPRMTLP